MNQPSTYKHDVAFSGMSNSFNPPFFNFLFLSLIEFIRASVEQTNHVRLLELRRKVWLCWCIVAGRVLDVTEVCWIRNSTVVLGGIPRIDHWMHAVARLLIHVHLLLSNP